jgi:vacuolar-type H+-ATPase subunit I/STV1
MANETDTAAFDNLDWSKFDFTRWNLDGLSLDDTSSTMATLLQRVIAAPQWPQSIGSSLPGLKSVVIQHLNAQIEELKKESADLDSELKSRLASTQAQIVALRTKMRLGTVPPVPAANPNLFQLVVKAVDQQSQFGLAGLTVNLFESADSENPVATGTTDSNGNAILSLSRQKAAGLAKEKTSELTVSIHGSDGKSIYSAAHAAPVRANQVETHIAAIPASQDTAASLAFATQQGASDNDLLETLTAKLDQLRTFYGSQKKDIQNQVATIDATIAAIKAELNPAAK